MDWEIEAYRRSVAGLSPDSVRAYASDVERFAEWAGRGGATGPADVDRIMLRRYLAFLATRRYAKATIARTAASLRSYFGWCAQRGLIDGDPSVRLSAPSPDSRLPRVLGHAELDQLLGRPSARDARTGGRRIRRRRSAGVARDSGTTPCSSCSTGAGCGWPSCAGSTWATSTSTAGWSP